MRLPMTNEEITEGWLSSALAQRWPGVVVKAAHREHVILGSATKIRLRLEYERNGGHIDLPQTLWIKIGLESFQHDVEATVRIYATEAVAYGKVLPRYRVNTPDCYFHGAQTEPPQGVLLLEDLGAKNVIFNSALNPLSITQVAAGLDTLASLHAQSWEDPVLESIDGLLPVLTSPLRVFFGQWVADAKQHFSAARGYAVPVALHDARRLEAGWALYPKLMQQGPQCFLHGDTHIGNSYLEADGSIGFLDWQIACTGHCVHDFTYFLITALDLPDRRHAERELLAHYLNALRSHGVKTVPDFDDAWQSYRQSVFYGFLAWLGSGDEFQPPEVNTACLARFGSAMLDLKTYEALGID